MTKSELKQLIRECIMESYSDADRANEDFLDRYTRILSSIVADFLNGKKRIYWPTIKANTIAKIWLVYGKRGTIYDEDEMDKIADQMVNLVVRLHITNMLGGHSQVDPREELDAAGYELTDKQWELFLTEYLTNAHGDDLVSDYGLRPLENLALKLLLAKTAEEKLLLVDRMLNVVHQRSDLALLFIDGGTATLNKIASQGGYSTEFEDFIDQMRQQRAY